MATENFTLDVKHSVCKARCPQCHSLISMSVGRFVGGFNDRGGWIVSCGHCHKLFPLRVANPTDASKIIDGGKVLASWDDEVSESLTHILARYDLTEVAIVSAEILIHEMPATEVEINAPGMRLFDRDTTALFTCPDCGKSVEDAAYTFLENKMDVLTKELGAFLNFYLKSGGRYEQVIVNGKAECECGTTMRTAFARPFVEVELLNADVEDYCLVDVDNAVSLARLDGVFTRNECLALLEKLLERWRAIHSVIFVAVPFIGFQYKNAAKKRVALWNRFLRHIEVSKTILITRKVTLKSLKEGLASEGTDFDFLRNYEMLNPLLAELENGKSFVQKSHAKFYAGVSGNSVEVLSGSFNLHDGEYAENICLRRYTFKEFQDQYLSGLGYLILPHMLIPQRSFLRVCLDEVTASCSVESHVGAMRSFSPSSEQIVRAYPVEAPLSQPVPANTEAHSGGRAAPKS